MRILLLAHRLPYPLESGQNLRLYHLARHVARRHELSVIGFGQAPHPPALTEVFASIHTLPIARVPREPLSVRKIIRALDVDQAVARLPAMERLIGNVVATERPEVIWVGGWDMLVYTARLSGIPVVADVIDDGGLEYAREVLWARRPLPFLLALKRLVNAVRWERRFFPHATRCLYVSEVDARWARRLMHGLPVAVVENGVDADVFRPLGEAEEFPSLVFEGNQGFPPNADAAAYLARTILPLVRMSFPECRLFIVGRDPDPRTLALASAHVVVTGRVDDVRPYLDRASLFVCPMRMGAGIKNKILQAWAMAKPVVATPVAAGGLRIRSGENIVVAGSASAFAREVVRLLDDPIRRRDLGKLARETVLAHYTWEQQAAALEDYLSAASRTAARTTHAAP
jgi:sugar transferase (PEP-CTERM/EpsH1 system associated)